MLNLDFVVAGGGHCCGDKYTPRYRTVQWQPTSNQQSHSSETHYHLLAEGSDINVSGLRMVELWKFPMFKSASTRNPLIPATLVVVSRR